MPTRSQEKMVRANTEVLPAPADDNKYEEGGDKSLAL
jgi:hypothetical protein